jgi:hypothetical protein
LSKWHALFSGEIEKQRIRLEFVLLGGIRPCNYHSQLSQSIMYIPWYLEGFCLRCFTCSNNKLRRLLSL